MQSKNRCLRVSDDVWDKWQGQAKAWGLSLVRALEAAMAASGEEFPDSGMKAWVTTPAKKKPAKKPGPWTKEMTDAAEAMAKKKAIMQTLCDHAGTEIGKLSGVGACPKCGKVVTK